MKSKALTIAFAAILGMGIPVANAATSHTEVPNWMNKKCSSEDSVNCHWGAKGQGNRKGWSYMVREFPGRAHMICVMYIDHPKSDYCINNH